MSRLGLLAILLLAMPGLAAAGNVVMVVNPDVAGQFVSRHFARSLFAMRLQQWPAGNGATVFVLPDGHPLHAAFSKDVINLFPHQLRVAWDRQVFSGTGRAPVEVGSEDEMLARVASTPGAVGYLSKDKVDEKRVRIVEVR